MTSATPKTIQIFLPGGDPHGIRVAELTTRIVQVIEVPRFRLGDFLKMPESGQVAVYFLVGDPDDAAEQRVYIGQSGELRSRLSSHHREKDFWQHALVLVSKTNSLTQTHALFLEWASIQAVRQAGRYGDENGNAGNKPFTPAPLEADCHEIFETGRTLLTTLGYPIFDPLTRRRAAEIDGGSASRLSEGEGEAEDEVFSCRGPNTDGRGQLTDEGFVVLKGSVGRREIVPSARNGWIEKARDELAESGHIREEGETVVFERDRLFNSPSGGSMILLGRTSNGWLDWKDERGRTLDELKRQCGEGTEV